MDIPTIYCEQINLPIQYLNIITSFLFIFFAFLSIKTIKNKYGFVQKRDYALAIMLSVFCVGSVAWHFIPNKWTDYADTIPIAIFAIVSFALIVKKIFNESIIIQITALALMILIGLRLERLPGLNGSLPYVFMFLLIALIAIFLKRKNPEAGRNLQIASIIFFLGIVFRTLDLFLCSYIPFGAHFLWHILVAIMGYYLINGISALYRK